MGGNQKQGIEDWNRIQQNIVDLCKTERTKMTVSATEQRGIK